MRLTIRNRQRPFQPHSARLRDLLRFLAERLRRERPADAWHKLALVLTDDRAIAAVNRCALGCDGPTDVIALEYEPVPGESDGLEAEVFVNLERAWSEGPRHGATPSQELALYAAHGFDHLCGADDRTPDGRRRMRRRERRWLAAFPAGTLFSRRPASAPRAERKESKP
jgi:rRNA maturation RNase YbeY